MTTLAGSPGADVLVVDDHRVFAETLAARLGSETGIREAQAVFSLGQAKDSAMHRSPDVVLLDPCLGDESGLDLVPHLDLLPRPPGVVVVADGHDPAAVVEGLTLGIRGWVSKEDRIEDLLQAIETVRNGDVHLPVEAWRPVMLELLADRRGRYRTDGFAESFTGRQRQILQCLVAGMSRTEIAERLSLSPHTVRTHLRDMFRAAGVHSSARLVARARAAGITSPLPEQSSGAGP